MEFLLYRFVTPESLYVELFQFLCPEVQGVYYVVLTLVAVSVGSPRLFGSVVLLNFFSFVFFVSLNFVSLLILHK